MYEKPPKLFSANQARYYSWVNKSLESVFCICTEGRNRTTKLEVESSESASGFCKHLCSGKEERSLCFEDSCWIISQILWPRNRRIHNEIVGFFFLWCLLNFQLLRVPETTWCWKGFFRLGEFSILSETATSLRKMCFDHCVTVDRFRHVPSIRSPTCDTKSLKKQSSPLMTVVECYI